MKRAMILKENEIKLSPSESLLYGSKRDPLNRAGKELLDEIRSERPVHPYQRPEPPECKVHKVKHTRQRNRPLSLPQFRLIVALRRKGWKLRAIAWEVSRSEGFVCAVIKNKAKYAARFATKTNTEAA